MGSSLSIAICLRLFLHCVWRAGSRAGLRCTGKRRATRKRIKIKTMQISMSVIPTRGFRVDEIFTIKILVKVCDFRRGVNLVRFPL